MDDYGPECLEGKTGSSVFQLRGPPPTEKEANLPPSKRMKADHPTPKVAATPQRSIASTPLSYQGDEGSVANMFFETNFC